MSTKCDCNCHIDPDWHKSNPDSLPCKCRVVTDDEWYVATMQKYLVNYVEDMEEKDQLKRETKMAIIAEFISWVNKV